MRFSSLSMERYAHVSGEVLTFPADRGLHVVMGANEAGKSTALKAIADALFGFDTRRVKALRHPDDPRIGFALLASDGTEGRFVRRKKNKDPLLNEAGQPVAEAMLLRFLGGTARQRFEEVFGLNGERLRQAGRTILSEHGEAGAAVLQAQTGLHGL
ncbi:MAG: AAA family ATPase, partial [Acetobacteraceae bacterium]|nr:AAA family ATPase [Acetobacteraceae bacterium]